MCTQYYTIQGVATESLPDSDRSNLKFLMLETFTPLQVELYSYNFVRLHMGISDKYIRDFFR